MEEKPAEIKDVKREEVFKYFVVVADEEEPGRDIVEFDDVGHMTAFVGKLINDIFTTKKSKYITVFYGKRLTINSSALHLKVGDLEVKKALEKAYPDDFVEL